METFCINGLSIILDGAHNNYSVSVLLQSIRNNNRLISIEKNHSIHKREVWVLFGAGADKNVDAMLSEVFNNESGADKCYFLKSSHFKALSKY